MSNKHSYKGKSLFQQGKGDSINFYFANVESVEDPFDGNRVKGRIKGVDDHLNLDELPWAFPMSDKHFHTTPKVGETVVIMVENARNGYQNRMYMGPIISQPQKMFYDKTYFSSQSLMDIGLTEPEEAPSTFPTVKGVYPNKEDVAMQGRGTTDIIQRQDVILIRAGKFTNRSKRFGVNNSIPEFNKETIGYIQIRGDAELEDPENSGEPKRGSVTNIVGSRINLLTHENGQPRFDLSDQTHMISDDEIKKILDEAHPLVFGDKLIEYLKLMKEAFINHVHAYHGKKAEDLAGTEYIDKYVQYDLDSLLSKNIRIN